MSNLSKSFIASIIALALCAPAMTMAAPDAGLAGTTMKVSYADLNLEKEEGAEILYQRLQKAAKQVCSVRTLSLKGSLTEAAAKTSCIRDTLGEAVKHVNNQHVNKIHAG
jgi:UrcA family protein